MLATHFWIRLRRDHVIAPTTEARRRVARTFFRLDHRRRLLAFGLADTHAHGLWLGDPRAARDLARRLEQSLQRQLGLPVGFAPVDWEPVERYFRLRNAFFYVLRQCRHHRLDVDPAFEGTNLPDLLGLRLHGGYGRELLRAALPRVHRPDLLGVMGVESLTPADGPLDGVRLATERALAIGTLTGRSQEVLLGRRAALAVLEARVAPIEAARLLEISRVSVHRLRRRPVQPALVAAIRGQLGLMAALCRDTADGDPYRCRTRASKSDGAVVKRRVFQIPAVGRRTGEL